MIFLLANAACVSSMHACSSAGRAWGSKAPEHCSPGDFAELPRDPVLVHRFLEAYRISRVYREEFKERTENLQQIYPGRIISVMESYPESIMEIHSSSRSALESLLESREGAVLDAMLMINGRLHFLDLLRPTPSGLKISLLKSDSRMKDNYYRETAWIVQGLAAAGYQVDEFSVYLLNSEYRREEGEVFVEHQLKRRHKFMRLSIEERFTAWRRLCFALPFPNAETAVCTFCAASIGEDSDIHHLYRSTGMVSALKEQGIKWIGELDRVALPLRQRLKPSHWIQHHTAVTGAEQLDLAKIREFLDSLDWPLYCLDFECFLEAIPSWKSSAVWEHIPFLFSLHVMDRDLLPEKVEHYLISDGEDRREEMARRLILAAGGQGSILVYGIALEQRILRQFARLFPALSGEISGLIERLVDLQKPFADFSYYHPGQKGKISLKTVLGLLTTLNYPRHQVTTGSAAFAGYYYLMHRDIDVSWNDYAMRVRNDPEGFFREIVEYCDIDSSALAHIVMAFIEKSAWKTQAGED